MIYVKSIMHTGTRFTINLIKQNELGKYTMSHFHDPTSCIPTTGSVVIVPIRRPEDVYVSWVSRGYNTFFFDEQWEMMQRFLNSFKETFLLPVDSNNKDIFLDKLSTYLGKRIETDWAPIGHVFRQLCEIPDMSHLYNIEVLRSIYGDH